MAGGKTGGAAGGGSRRDREVGDGAAAVTRMRICVKGLIEWKIRIS